MITAIISMAVGIIGMINERDKIGAKYLLSNLILDIGSVSLILKIFLKIIKNL